MAQLPKTSLHPADFLEMQPELPVSIDLLPLHGLKLAL